MKYVINLTITKQTTKVKKQKDTVSNLSKYWLIMEFEKWRAIRASMGGAGGARAWVAC